jgi:hypoxanthine phosphoribosyltransferase
MNKLFLSPLQCEDAYNACLKELVIRISPKDIDLIVAPMYGAFWFAKKLAKDWQLPWTGIELSRSRNVFSNDIEKFKNKRLLLVDDIYDTGKTLKYFNDYFMFKSLNMLTLTSKSYTPNIKGNKVIYGKYIEPHFWVVFPWEKEYEELSIGVDEMIKLKDFIENSKNKVNFSSQ